MKNIPQPEDEKKSPEGDAVPVLPGTEKSRSLGDMMLEAEKSLQAENAATDPSAVTSTAKTDQSKKRHSRKPSRAQARRFARERALQALYQWDVSKEQASTVRNDFMAEQDMSRVDVDYFTRLFNGVSHDPDAVDSLMTDALDRALLELDPIERAVLRLATFELSECQDIPGRVVINEGIEITKRFGADNGHKYINGVLDKLAMQIRPLEMKRK